MTESGKSTLAKRMAHRYHDHNEVPLIILDSLNDPEWPQGERVFQTTDPDEFLRVFWSSKRCACFIDEAGDAVGRYNTVMHRTATRGRHWGHSVHYISQRGVQIAPTVRDQCGHLFLLTSSVKDGKVHADEWNRPELLECNTFAKGNYIHCTRFGSATRGSLFGLPWETHNGTDTDIRDGGRNLRRKTRPGAPSEEEKNLGPRSDPGTPANSGDPADSDPGSSGNSADLRDPRTAEGPPLT
jgi:hypothetical protein